MFEHLTSSHWLFILCIPLVGAAVGYVVNTIGSLLTYGANSHSKWGLMYSKRHYFVRQLYKHLLHSRISSAQLYEHMGPEKMVKQILQGIKPRLDGIIDDAMGEDHDIFWENLPITVKNRFYGRAHKLLPRIVDDIVEDIGDNIDRLTRLEHIITERLTSPNMSIGWIVKQSYIDAINKLPLRGILIGYLLGFPLLTAWVIFPHWAILIGGYSLIALSSAWLCHTNFASSQLNSLTLANLLATQPLSPSSMINTLIMGSNGKYTRNLIKKHSAPIIEQTSLRAFAQLTIGPSGYAAVKHQLAKNLSDAYLDAFNDTRFNDTQGQQIATYLAQTFETADEQSTAFMNQVNSMQMRFLLPMALLMGSLAGLILQLLISKL